MCKKQATLTEQVTFATADQHQLMASEHINNTLMAGEVLDMLQLFKKEPLIRFEGTDEGEVTMYLGCGLMWNKQARTIVFRHTD